MWLDGATVDHTHTHARCSIPSPIDTIFPALEHEVHTLSSDLHEINRINVSNLCDAMPMIVRNSIRSAEWNMHDSHAWTKFSVDKTLCHWTIRQTGLSKCFEIFDTIWRMRKTNTKRHINTYDSVGCSVYWHFVYILWFGRRAADTDSHFEYSYPQLNQIEIDIKMEEVQKHSVHTLVFRSLKRSHDMFVSHQKLKPANDENLYVYISFKSRSIGIQNN